MVFRALQEKLKVNSGRKLLKKLIAQPKAPANRAKGLHTIGCIVDMDNFPDADTFYGLRNDFALRPNGVQIIGYKREYDKTSPFGIQFFTDRDLGWDGQIENGHVTEFLSREYDVLINYYERETLLLKLLTLSTSARLRVGFSEVDHRLNDLILDTTLEEIEAFKLELKKYLTVLGEY